MKNMEIFTPDMKEREILSWFCKPFFDSAIKQLGRDAVIVLLKHIARTWNSENGAMLLAEADDKKSWYGVLGPDALLVQAMREEIES